MTTTTKTRSKKLSPIAEVMDKIAKIQALAARGGTQHEAEVAAAKMAKLLLDYNLTLADVDTHAKATNRKVRNETILTGHLAWRVDLLNAIADAHLCKAIRHMGTAKRRTDGKAGQMTVVGHEHNLIVVLDTYQWLKGIAQKMVVTAIQEAKQSGDVTAMTLPRKWTCSWCLGFAEGVREAYDAMAAEAKREAGTDTWAIVPVLEAEVATRYAELFPNATTTIRPHNSLGGAWAAGKEAGRKTNLQRQIGGSSAGAALSA